MSATVLRNQKKSIAPFLCFWRLPAAIPELRNNALDRYGNETCVVLVLPDAFEALRGPTPAEPKAEGFRDPGGEFSSPLVSFPARL